LAYSLLKQRIGGREMASAFGRLDSEILHKVSEGRLGGLSSVNPVVLSCGGIYIPHQGANQRIIYHIITTANENTPVKVVTCIRPRNILQQLLSKESMN
jgi:hypothetical protein